MVTPPPPLQRFPFGRDNFKNILVRTFKFGIWVYIGNASNAIVCDLDLQFQGHWWPLKGQILAIFSRIFDSSYVLGCGRDFKLAD